MVSETEAQIAGVLTTVIRPDKTLGDFVFLHGYDMQRHSFSAFARSLNLPATSYFPQAERRISEFGFSWWTVDHQRRAEQLARGARDLVHTFPPDRREARERFVAVLKEIERSRPKRPVILGGFSQGGMLAFDAVLSGHAVDGLVLLSASRLAIEEPAQPVTKLEGLPVLITHGTRDRNVSVDAGRALANELRERGCAVEWLEFDGDHETPLTVWRAVRKFVAKRLRSIASAC